MSIQNSPTGSIVKKLTPAQIWNARYNTNNSVFISAKERINQYCQAVPGSMDQLLHAIRDFKKNNPNLTAKNIKLAKAAKAKLTDIRIDDTMNRPLDWAHVLKILRNFKETRVLAVNVYEDPDAPNCYIAWDGQHTTVVLYIIYAMIYQVSPSNIVIPVVITSTNDKAVIRENFIHLNTDESEGGGKAGLSPLDKWSQKVFGVRMDKSTNEDWIKAEQQQSLLEDADLFLTRVAYQNTESPGAITQVDKLIKEDIDIVEKFCKYWKERKQFEYRYVDSKEVIMIIHFFKSCKEHNIEVSDTYIKDMTKIFWDAFECEFTGDGLKIFWNKLHTAYLNWYNKHFPPPKKGEEDTRPEKRLLTKDSNHQLSYGLAFMISLLKKKGFKHKLPKSLVDFVPAKADLW